MTARTVNGWVGRGVIHAAKRRIRKATMATVKRVIIAARITANIRIVNLHSNMNASLIHAPVSECSCALPYAARKTAPRCSSPLTHRVIGQLQAAGVTVYNAGVQRGPLGVTLRKRFVCSMDQAAARDAVDSLVRAALDRLNVPVEDRIVAGVVVRCLAESDNDEYDEDCNNDWELSIEL